MLRLQEGPIEWTKGEGTRDPGLQCTRDASSPKPLAECAGHPGDAQAVSCAYFHSTVFRRCSGSQALSRGRVTRAPRGLSSTARAGVLSKVLACLGHGHLRRVTQQGRPAWAARGKRALETRGCKTSGALG